MSNEFIYPYFFERIAVVKPWAGSALSSVFPGLAGSLPPSTGETAEIADTDGLSTLIRGGPARGQTLHQLAQKTGMNALYGEGDGGDGLPLMLKYLDTAEALSVQVHPGDRHESGRLIQRGKSEAWLVLRAEPGAFIYQGKKADIHDQDFWAAVESGRASDVMNVRHVAAGDFIDSPAGMVHAIGGGLVLLELQQNSNVTYRVHDWPRRDGSMRMRTVHPRESREAARLGLQTTPAMRAWPQGDGTSNLTVELRHQAPFAWHSRTLVKPERVECASRTMRLLTCVEGSLEVTCQGADMTRAINLTAPDSVLVPAALDRMEFYPRGLARILEAEPVKARELR